MKFKNYLLAPGPTAIPSEISLFMAKPIPHHRSEDFIPLFQEVKKGLKWLFQTQSDVLILASSGTGAMESAVTNFLNKGDKAIVVRGGKFGERWAEICKSYGVEPVNIDVEWGKSVEVSSVEDALKRHKDARAIFLQASETSTGAKHPVREIVNLVKAREDIITVVDAFTEGIDAPTWACIYINKSKGMDVC